MSKILLGSEAFKVRLEEVAKNATESFYAQAMTFEGDAAGEWLIETMKSSPARDKRLLVDSYSKVVINDHFVISTKYLIDEYFRKEVINTKKVLADAEKAGIQVKFTNPVGLFGQKYPLRNHKKLVLLDGAISYLGGINFSDHNFAWHDMMVEMGDAEVGEALVDDFQQTWEGINQSRKISTSKGEVYLFNGIASKVLYENLFDHLREAKNSIQIISPYVSEPLLSVLQEIAKSNVAITIISPTENNKSIFRNLILSEFKKGYFNLKEFEGMSHMKAILIDEEKLLFGSSNYDLVSYYFEQEVVMVSKDQDLIHQFKDQVLAHASDLGKVNISAFSAWKASTLMKLLDGFGKFASASFLKPR